MEGSIPSAILGSALLFALAVVKYTSLWLSTRHNTNVTEVEPMTKNNGFGWFSMLETIWSVGTGIVAGALPT